MSEACWLYKFYLARSSINLRSDQSINSEKPLVYGCFFFLAVSIVRHSYLFLLWSSLIQVQKFHLTKIIFFFEMAK